MTRKGEMAQSWCETAASGRSKGSRDRRGCQLWPGCRGDEVRQPGARYSVALGAIRELKKQMHVPAHGDAADFPALNPLVCDDSNEVDQDVERFGDLMMETW